MVHKVLKKELLSNQKLIPKSFFIFITKTHIYNKNIMKKYYITGFKDNI